MTELDKKKGKKGSALEEIRAHIFLEKASEAVTWVDMRATLKDIDIDFDKKMSLTEFFVYTNKLDWKALVNATAFSGEVKRQMDEAQVKLSAATDAQEKATADATAADEAAEAAAASHEAAEEAEAKAKKEAEDAAAEEEV